MTRISDPWRCRACVYIPDSIEIMKLGSPWNSISRLNSSIRSNEETMSPGEVLTDVGRPG